MESSYANSSTVDEFDLEKYLRVAVGTRPESFDWSEPGPPLDEGTLFCLGFMLDVEANTIVNMRELLSTTIAEDPSIAAFLACWLYEEWSHSRTLGKLLELQGVRIDASHFTGLSRQTPGDYIAQKCARLAALFTDHFPAIHMTWGAINELTGILAYEALIDRAQHPMVTTVLSRIIKDERRHFAFLLQSGANSPEAARRAETNLGRVTRLLEPRGESGARQSGYASNPKLSFSPESGETGRPRRLMGLLRAYRPRMVRLPEPLQRGSNAAGSK